MKLHSLLLVAILLLGGCGSGFSPATSSMDGAPGLGTFAPQATSEVQGSAVAFVEHEAFEGYAGALAAMWPNAVVPDGLGTITSFGAAPPPSRP